MGNDEKAYTPEQVQLIKRLCKWLMVIFGSLYLTASYLSWWFIVEFSFILLFAGCLAAWKQVTPAFTFTKGMIIVLILVGISSWLSYNTDEAFCRRDIKENPVSFISQEDNYQYCLEKMERGRRHKSE